MYERNQKNFLEHFSQIAINAMARKNTIKGKVMGGNSNKPFVRVRSVL